MKISIQIDQKLIDLKSEMVSITQNIMVDHVNTVNYQLGLTRRTCFTVSCVIVGPTHYST